MTIRSRIIGATMLVVGAATVAYTAYFIDQGRRDLVRQLEAKILENDRLLAVVTAGPLYDGAVEHLDSVLDSFFADPEMLRIELKERDGDIHLAREREPGSALGRAIASRIDVRRGLDTLGDIHTTYTTALIEQRLRAARSQALLMSTLLIALLSVVILFVARGVTRPIDRLTAAAHAMAQGDLEQALEPRGAEEVASLAESFVRMRDAIRARMVELNEQNSRLTAEVAQRRAVEEERARLISILEATPDLVAITDPAGKVLYLNRAGRVTIGLEEGVLPDLDVGRLYPRWAADWILREGVPAAVRQGQWSGEAAVRAGDGTEVPVSLVILGHRDAGGRLHYLSAVMRDIRESRQAQAALQTSEERLRQALRATGIGIYDHDQRADVLYWSEGQRAIFGVGADGPVSLQVYLERLHPEDRERVGAAVQRAHDPAGDGAFDIEYRIVRAGGEIRWLSNRGQTFFEGEGTGRRAVRSVGVVVDITERRDAEEERAKLQAQLAHAQRLETVGRLAGGIAHDFNNMLHVIIGFAELLKQRLPADKRLSAYTAEIERAALRSREVTRQLLAFSRRQMISPAPSNLNTLIAATTAAMARLIGEDVELRVVADEGLWTVNVDPAQVDQILINLAVNARDAMPTGGKLTIETANVHFDEAYCRQHVGAKPGPYVLVAVSDSGLGMDKDTLSHIFEPFFTTKASGKGTGLGLATVQGIVEQNGGFINAYSEPGRGTTFKVYLPRGVGQGGTVAQAPEAARLRGSGRVLVVEDEDAVRRLTSALVESLGYTVVAADSPAEAIRMCERDDFEVDVVLTDVVMPEMSGKQLRDRLLSLRPGIRVIFTSGYTANVIAHHGILEGGVHFIAKPFGVTELARKLREVLAPTATGDAGATGDARRVGPRRESTPGGDRRER